MTADHRHKSLVLTMNSKPLLGNVFLCIVSCISIQVISGAAFGFPQFESEWMLLTAHVPPAELRIPHGLGVVPVIVDVLVKAIDGPNEGFIFRAEGTSERDDDLGDPYGGVVYIYNQVYVRVMAPYYMNQNDIGSALYTGSAPYWTGVNSQTSYTVMVRVRCWVEELLPPPCFEATGIHMHASSAIPGDTFQELVHGHDDYPALVKVRVLLTNSLDVGWYSDGQGAAKVNVDTLIHIRRTGGLKFAYNNETIRIWASSTAYGYLETHVDGWGNDRVYFGYSDTGLVEVRVWCQLASMIEHRLPFGPSTINEQLEFPIDFRSWALESIQLSVMVEAIDGPNKGFRFESAGNGYTNTLAVGTPCAFGGVLNAYSSTAFRFWRPNNGTGGGAICIPNLMGDGTYAQSSLDGILVVTVWRHPSMNKAEYEPLRLVCNKFKLLQNETAYNGEPIDVHPYMSSIVSCDHACRQHDSCITYEYVNTTCSMHNTTDESLFYQLQGSQVWGLESRSVTIED